LEKRTLEEQSYTREKLLSLSQIPGHQPHQTTTL